VGCAIRDLVSFPTRRSSDLRTVDRLDRPGIEVMDISVRRNAFGRQVDSFEADVPIEGVEGGPFHAVFIRAPIIEAVSGRARPIADRKSTRLNSSHVKNSYAV